MPTKGLFEGYDCQLNNTAAVVMTDSTCSAVHTLS